MEVKFEDDKQGKVQVVASPVVRLTNKPNATIEEIGTPERLIASLGPFVTGNTYDPDELLEASVQKNGNQTVINLKLGNDVAHIQSQPFDSLLFFSCSITAITWRLHWRLQAPIIWQRPLQKEARWYCLL